MELFDTLPIAALIGERRFFCVHGGLSPHLKKIDALTTLDRFHDIPETGLFSDIMWSPAIIPAASADSPGITLPTIEG